MGSIFLFFYWQPQKLNNKKLKLKLLNNSKHLQKKITCDPFKNKVNGLGEKKSHKMREKTEKDILINYHIISNMLMKMSHAVYMCRQKYSEE